MALDVHPQLLRALLAVLETGSFTEAAEALGFTQSALSKQVAALEHAAGVTLFERQARGVRPTKAASRLARRATAVLDQLDVAERELDDLAQPLHGALALGGFPATAAHLVPGALARLRAEHPTLAVTFAEGPTPVLLRRLRAGRLDLAVVAATVATSAEDLAGLLTERLPSGRLQVAVSRHHRLAHLERVPVGELAGEQWVAGRGVRGEPQFGPWPTLDDPTVVVRLADWHARLAFVAAGLGITTVPSLVAGTVPDDVVTLDVDDPERGGGGLLLAHAAELGHAGAALRRALVAVAREIADA
ncbi:LysR family transcriptional regulator [Jatrophihabitans sp. YIM 134969]